MNDEERYAEIRRLLKEARSNLEDAAELAEELPHKKIPPRTPDGFAVILTTDLDDEIDEAKDFVRRALDLVEMEVEA